MSAATPADRFELRRCLGRGGQGTVYLAWDRKLARQVVLKLPHHAWVRDFESLLRLRREAEVLARLDHPGICRLYEIVDENLPGDSPPLILVMQYVEGRTLAEHLAAARAKGGLHLPGAAGAGGVLAILRFFQRAAEALAYAHQRGVIHRDLKPANIMVTPAGEPVLLDFGLARLLERGQDLTLTGQVLGTLAYMAPEQLAGGGTASPALDTYALAATLYECLALRPPYTAPTRAELFHRVRTGVPPDVRRFNRAVPRPVSQFLAVALARDPGRRYADGGAMAADLGRLLAHRPLAAQPPGPLARCRLWVARNRAAAAVMALLGALLLAAGLSALNWRRASERANGYTLVVAATQILERDPAEALLLALEAHRRVPGRATRRLLYEALVRLAEVKTLPIGAQAAAVRRLAFSPDGRRLFAQVGPAGWKAWVWADGRPAAGSPPPGALRSQPEVSLGSDGTLQLASGENSRRLALPPGNRVTQVFADPEGRFLCLLREDSPPEVLDVATGTLVVRLDGQQGEVTAAAFGPAGRLLATGSADGEVRLWALPTGEALPPLRGHRGPVRALAFSPDGRLLATAAADGTLRVWRTRPPGRTRFRVGAAEALEALFSARGRWLFFPSVAARGGGLLAERAGGRERLLPPAQRGAFAPEEDFLLLVTRRGREARFLDLAGERVAARTPLPFVPLAAAVAPGGRWAALSGPDGVVLLWEPRTGRRSTLRGHRGPVTDLMFDPEGRYLASAADDGTARLWEVETGHSLAVLRGHGSPVVWPVRFHPRAPLLATGSDAGRVRLWRVPSGSPAAQAPGRGRVLALRFSPGGRYLAVVRAGERRVRLLDGERLSPAGALPHEAAPQPLLAWGPEGRLATATGGHLYLWELRTLAVRLPLPARPAALAAGPRACRVLTADGRLLTWPWDPVAAARERAPRRLDEATLAGWLERFQR